MRMTVTMAKPQLQRVVGARYFMIDAYKLLRQMQLSGLRHLGFFVPAGKLADLARVLCVTMSLTSLTLGNQLHGSASNWEAFADALVEVLQLQELALRCRGALAAQALAPAVSQLIDMRGVHTSGVAS